MRPRDALPSSLCRNSVELERRTEYIHSIRKALQAFLDPLLYIQAKYEYGRRHPWYDDDI